MESCLKKIFALVLTVASLLATAAPLQDSASDDSDPQFSAQRNAPTELDKIEKKQEKMRLEDREKDIRKDTAKLLQLATELKQAVDKTDEHMLSLDVVRKAEEIEKLSKQIKNKMKGD